ncbi:ribosomal protein L7/L12 [Nocardia blacklockiae]|uniref:ribosomal protein L7/L12 n=1 Tax=Nocardia blacklockiae TaxID=480036 RepID=UPI0018941735|nr:ribosomal protein L7/L12 [Nocardia blacklockiae]MBF6172438.1 ribosomal protein L7/L12 [Nocardia blacklockiae]
MFENRRLARIERKLDAIMHHLGIADTEPPPIATTAAPMPGMHSSEVDNLLSQGKKIQAIKVYRELNPGMSLKQAKDAVEARARRYY